MSFIIPGQDLVLQGFFEAHFGNANVNYTIPEPDQYLAEDSARIAPMGTYLGRYEDLTLAAPLGGGREKQYMQRFQQGAAGWYHMPLNTTDKKSIARNAMREVRHCAIAVYHGGGKERLVTHFYDVKSVRLVKRCDMSIEQAGKIDGGNKAEYWLFELGYARPLPQPLSMSGLRSFKFQLTNVAELLTAKSWEELPRRYALLK